MSPLLRVMVSLTPVVVFLVFLRSLDSLRIVRVRWLVASLLWGVISAFLAAGWASVLRSLTTDWQGVHLWSAAVMEEILKALFVWWLYSRHKAGFLIDGVIFAFAVGTGFAVIENVYYLWGVPDGNPAIWLLRGFGTSIMHGGAVSITAILYSWSREKMKTSAFFWLSLIPAILLHLGFNLRWMNTYHQAAAQILVFPFLLYVLLKWSEQDIKKWLGSGLDRDMDFLLELRQGRFGQTAQGRYVKRLSEYFPGEVVVDMICYLRLHRELGIRAKGILMMKEAGLALPPADPELKDQMRELAWLRRSIGRAGLSALAPVLRISDREIWQLNMLQE